jgi:anti-sigma28 factor (negative regulator of flagellin synthesis)
MSSEGGDRNIEALLELGRILRAHADGSEEREELLNDLAARIRAGTYHVDAHELARKILEEEEALRISRPEPDNPE